jgi:hypothetical protein
MKEGDRIFTPDGSGVIITIEEIYGKKRYCVEFDNKNGKFGESICCYYSYEVMNDIGYIDEPYEKSILCTSISNNNDLGQLKLKLMAIDAAISFHESESNPGQVKFFQAAKDHVCKKLKIEPKVSEVKPGTQLSLI